MTVIFAALPVLMISLSRESREQLLKNKKLVSGDVVYKYSGETMLAESSGPI